MYSVEVGVFGHNLNSNEAKTKKKFQHNCFEFKRKLKNFITSNNLFRSIWICRNNKIVNRFIGIVGKAKEDIGKKSLRNSKGPNNSIVFLEKDKQLWNSFLYYKLIPYVS